MARPAVTYLGSTKSWTITLRNSQGVAMTSYTVSDTLSAAVWAGKDQATLLTPTVAWNNPPAGTVDMTITAAQLAAAAIMPGLYRVDVTVTTVADGEPSLGFSGPLLIEDAPGSAAVLSTYATTADVTGVAPGIDGLQSVKNDLAGWLAQRHEARVQFDNRVLIRYRPQPGRSRRMVNAEHTGAGPYLVFSRASGDAPVPTLDEVKTWLEEDRLVLTPEIRLQNAYLAAALVYEDQIVVSPQGANTYAALAKLYHDRAEEQWHRCMVEFDDSADVPADSPTHRIDRDVTFLT